MRTWANPRFDPAAAVDTTNRRDRNPPRAGFHERVVQFSVAVKPGDRLGGLGEFKLDRPPHAAGYSLIDLLPEINLFHLSRPAASNRPV